MVKKEISACTGNSYRSQIAEVYLHTLYAGDKASIYSAGIETYGVNPWPLKQ